ncbi:MAG: hypothetical protein QOF70_6182 [Acetobacteraceae bacterium]|nr:hypothetical protein [Acetobacteraceae bacterium]
MEILRSRIPDDITPRNVAAVAAVFLEACKYAREVLPKLKTGVAFHDDKDTGLIAMINEAVAAWEAVLKSCPTPHETELRIALNSRLHNDRAQLTPCNLPVFQLLCGSPGRRTLHRQSCLPELQPRWLHQGQPQSCGDLDRESWSPSRLGALRKRYSGWVENTCEERGPAGGLSGPA